MTKSIILSLILISFLNCKQKNENNEKNNTFKIESKEKDSLEVTTNKVTNNTIEIRNSKTKLDTLIPIEILNAKTKNVYKKYGLEFSGNCYACDLAQISIENHRIFITNVCDDKTVSILEIKKLINTKNKIEINTENYNFTFLRVEDEPIYKLEITNYDVINKDLRISEYYTLKKDLIKFDVHDCGDFDG